MTKPFRPYTMHQPLLLPPSLRDWLPDGHLALFIDDVVEHALDLTAIYASYEGDGRGRPPFDPRLMVKLLVYGYCTGKTSSRKIELATYEEVPYRLLSADQHPDHDSIAAFRKRHLPALASLFKQVLKLAIELDLTKLGHVALDGTKIKANASKHKAMSYQRMCEIEKKLDEEVQALLNAAKQSDAEEDRKLGKGKRDNEVPSGLARKEDRLKKIRQAKAALEEQAREMTKAQQTQALDKLEERTKKEAATGKKVSGRPPQVPDINEAKPDGKAQRNFTDPESRIMKDGASKAFEQAYNAQAAVDENQIIVAADLTQQVNDKRQLVPMFEQVRENMGRLPDKGSADCGYFSEAAVTHNSLAEMELYVPPDRHKHGQPLPNPEGDAETMGTADKMRRKLAEPAGRDVYKMRKAIVEPVFGQTKQIRGFRRFSFRGYVAAKAEWLLVCATHNLLKIFRSGRKLRFAGA